MFFAVSDAAVLKTFFLSPLILSFFSCCMIGEQTNPNPDQAKKIKLSPQRSGGENLRRKNDSLLKKMKVRHVHSRD